MASASTAVAVAGGSGSGMSGLVDLDGEGPGGATGSGGGARIVFVLTAYLSVPEIEVRPSIDEVQGKDQSGSEQARAGIQRSMIAISGNAALTSPFLDFQLYSSKRPRSSSRCRRAWRNGKRASRRMAAAAVARERSRRATAPESPTMSRWGSRSVYELPYLNDSRVHSCKGVRPRSGSDSVYLFGVLGRQGGRLGAGQLRHLGKGDEVVRLEER